MSTSEKSMIVAYSYQGRVIGSSNRLPWAGQLRADMNHFRQKTEGTSVIMGRSTYESIPERFRPLSGRQNIVLSRAALAIEGVTVAHSLEEAYEKAELPIMVIGGASVYEQALDSVDTVHATEVLARFPYGDAFFPELPREDWQPDLTTQEFHKADANNTFAYAFVTYRRKHPTFR